MVTVRSLEACIIIIRPTAFSCVHNSPQTLNGSTLLRKAAAIFDDKRSFGGVRRSIHYFETGIRPFYRVVWVLGK